MPRIARALADNACYHIINRGNARQQVFHSDDDYRSFIDLMHQTRDTYSVRLHAWGLMPNHFHLLVQPEKGEQLTKWIQWVMTSHVRRHHRCYGTSGQIWQGRYKSFIIQDNGHLLTVARYIEANPVRAGLAEAAARWSWSSHAVRVAAADGLLLDSFPLSMPENWADFVNMPLSDGELEKLRNSVNRQSPFGEDDWRDELCEKMGLLSTIRSRGWQKGRKRGSKLCGS